MSRRRKRPLVLVRDLVPGTALDSCFFVRGFSPGAGNGPKLRARIWDRTGEASLIAWNWDEGAALPDGAYRVVGTVGSYAGNVQVCAERVEPCQADAELQELLPASPRPIGEMWAELEHLCAHCEDAHLRALLQLCLADGALCQRWRTAPAAARHHHAYTGGLLEHTLGVARLVLSLAEHYPALDRDLLLAGALLHDIGKTEAYTANGLPDMTDSGRLLGHIYPGARLVDGFVDRLPDFPRELRGRLLHLVGSHHGDRQFGVLEVPRTPEALLLHYADNLDAKMHAVLLACAQARGQVWTGPVRSLGDERVYVGDGRDQPRPPEGPEGVLGLVSDDAFSEGLFAADDLDG